MIQLPREPLFFDPIFHEKVWGGFSLKHKLDKQLPVGASIGESWELSGVNQHQSIVSRGVHKGTALQQLLQNTGAQLTGKLEKEFPLLLKFIDATQRLSVQVHPNDAQAQRNGWGDSGKTECWYVVDTKHNAQLITGFSCDVNRELLLDALETKSIENYLNFVPIKPGEVYFIPAGTVHAILGECIIYEVQQPSDTTFRFYDWNRIDESQKPRALHIQEALGVVDMSKGSNYRIEPVILEFDGYTHAYRIACRYFTLEELRFSRAVEARFLQVNSMRVISVLHGSISIHCAGTDYILPKGSTTLLPFILGDYSIHSEPSTHVIITSIPDLAEHVVKPLIAQKISFDKITTLSGSEKNNDFFLHQ